MITKMSSNIKEATSASAQASAGVKDSSTVKKEETTPSPSSNVGEKSQIPHNPQGSVPNTTTKSQARPILGNTKIGVGVPQNPMYAMQSMQQLQAFVQAVGTIPVNLDKAMDQRRIQMQQQIAQQQQRYLAQIFSAATSTPQSSSSQATSAQGRGVGLSIAQNRVSAAYPVSHRSGIIGGGNQTQKNVTAKPATPASRGGVYPVSGQKQHQQQQAIRSSYASPSPRGTPLALAATATATATPTAVPIATVLSSPAQTRLGTTDRASKAQQLPRVQPLPASSKILHASPVVQVKAHHQAVAAASPYMAQLSSSFSNTAGMKRTRAAAFPTSTPPSHWEKKQPAGYPMTPLSNVSADNKRRAMAATSSTTSSSGNKMVRLGGGQHRGEPNSDRVLRSPGIPHKSALTGLKNVTTTLWKSLRKYLSKLDEDRGAQYLGPISELSTDDLIRRLASAEEILQYLNLAEFHELQRSRSLNLFQNKGTTAAAATITAAVDRTKRKETLPGMLGQNTPRSSKPKPPSFSLAVTAEEKNRKDVAVVANALNSNEIISKDIDSQLDALTRTVEK